MKDSFTKLLAFLCLLVLLFNQCRNSDIHSVQYIHRTPSIQPDYTDITLPPNIAPLNFKILEEADRYHVVIKSTNHDSIELRSTSPIIQISTKKWRQLLSRNKGEPLVFEIYIQQQQEWKRFDKIINTIATESVDPFLAYRIFNPAFYLWKKMGIFQRDVQSFEEKPILRNTELSICLNCHSFCNQETSHWSLHLRYSKGGMLLTQKDRVVNVDTRSEINPSLAAYTSWHPSGELIAFSTDKVKQFFHSTNEIRDVIDLSSDLFFYTPSTNKVTTFPQISSPNHMETLPVWSPDGSYLYFCSAAQIDPDVDFKEQYRNIKYDLMRIKYNLSTHTLGKLETVLSSSNLQKTFSHPKISPDGKFLMYCEADYGYFTIYRPECDLYLLNLETNERSRLALNSNQTDSYHSWSSNSRWIVFSSKREDGIYTRLYFSYIDDKGIAHKPFILPQEDPTFYDRFLWIYNVPELITKPVQQTERELVEKARAGEEVIKVQ